MVVWVDNFLRRIVMFKICMMLIGVVLMVFVILVVFV